MAAVTDSQSADRSLHAIERSDAGESLIPGVFGYLTATAVLLWMFWSTLSQLPAIWDNDPNYSHGYIVPVAFLLFAIRIWRQGGAPIHESVPTVDFVSGLIRIVAGAALHFYFGELIGAFLFDVVALVLIAGGIVLAIGGRTHYRRFAFPLWFLVFMAPLPAVWYGKFAILMQEIASAVSEVIFSAFAVPVFREGCKLSIPGFQMEVGAACSGLRQLAAIVALSLAVGHLSNKTGFYKWTLGLLSIPIAIGANCVRVTLTGFILMWFGREWAEGVYHTMEGLAIVAVAAVMILLTAWWLSRFKLSQIREKPGETTLETPEPETKPALNVRRRLLALAVIVAVCAGGNIFVDRHITAVETPGPVPLQSPLASLPMQLGDWKGVDREISERAAYGDQHVSRDYTHQRTGQQVNLWVIYSGVGLDRGHHPEVCYSTAGKQENAAVRQMIDVPGHPKPVQQYQFGSTTGSEWVFYWHYALPATSVDQLDRLQQFYLKMHHQPSSATLQVTTSSYSEASAKGAREFVRLVDAAIQKHVGKTAIRGNHRKQVTVIRSLGGQ